MQESNKTTCTPATAKNDHTRRMVTGLIIFVAGFVCGIAFTVYRSDTARPAPHQDAAGQTASGDMHQALAGLEAEIKTNPNNGQTWTRLGNLYFDMDQPEKAIEAYQKSLALQGDNPNVITDLGVMYRKVGQPQKAIEAFNKAIAINPQAKQARFNKGIVQLYDLGDKAAAIASWEELLRLDPQAQSSNGDSIRDFVDQLQNAPGAGGPPGKK